jgi:hypothetical protein
MVMLLGLVQYSTGGGGKNREADELGRDKVEVERSRWWSWSRWRLPLVVIGTVSKVSKVKDRHLPTFHLPSFPHSSSRMRRSSRYVTLL